jgi:hypothetical protein
MAGLFRSSKRGSIEAWWLLETDSQADLDHMLVNVEVVIVLLKLDIHIAIAIQAELDLVKVDIWNGLEAVANINGDSLDNPIGTPASN